MYIINPQINFICGFPLTAEMVNLAIMQTNQTLEQLPAPLFRSIDYKTTSAMIGCILCENIAQLTHGTAIVNPIEKGHPDIVPIEALNASEEELRNYPIGLEVKCTIGNIPAKSALRKAESRIHLLNGITWQAHHREVTELLGITYDYYHYETGNKPLITGTFYSNNLCESDWGKISGTEGRNTKVTSMLKSGKNKMASGWFSIINDERYINKYTKILKFNIQGD